MGDSGKQDELDVGEKLVAPPDFSGPTGNRKITDVLCLLLIIVVWAAMTAIGIYSIQNGDYRIVVNPLDYDGNICGSNFARDMTDFPVLYTINGFGGGVCMSECPSLENLTDNGVTDIRSFITYDGFWAVPNSAAELTSDIIKVADYSTSEDSISCTEELCFPNDSPVQSWESVGVNEGFGFAYYVADSYPILSRCFLTLDALITIQNLTEASNSTLQARESTYEFWNRLYGDLWTARIFILGAGFGLSVIISFVYVMLLRVPILLNLVVWLSIFIAISMFCLGGVLAYLQANAWAEEEPQVYSDTAINATRIVAFVLIGVGVAFFFLMCCLRRQIQLAIGCVKETGRAVSRMPLIIIVPILQAGGLVAFMTAFVVYAVHLASLGEITVQDFPIANEITVAVRRYQFDDFIKRSAWYLLFCFFWTANFIVAIGDLTIAMSIAKWYFTWDKKDTSSLFVFTSLKDTIVYHLGTCAYGSLVLSVVQYVRVILTRIQKEAKKANSRIADCLLCCCQCCLLCLEKCIKFLNKNAYTQTAIFGTSFCVSAREAFLLILRNAGRIAAISYVSGAVLVVGKLLISTVTTTFSYYIMIQYIGDEVNSIGGPTVLVFLISYFVSDMFMGIFDVGINAILQCFVADEEMFDGDECYAEGPLQKWIDEYEDD